MKNEARAEGPKATDMNENDDNKVKPRSGHLGFMSPVPKTIIRNSPLRDYLKAAKPDLESDIDQFSNQLEHLSVNVLTAIIEGDDTTCGKLGIEAGKLDGNQQKGLASEQREKRKLDRANSQRYFFAIGAIIITAIVAVIFR